MAASCAMPGRRSGATMMSVSPALPAAEGTVITGKAPNNNLALDVVVKHLAVPQKLTPPANSYVVWLRPKDVAAQNIGALTVNQNLDGRLSAVTAMRSFELFITAEDSAQKTEPSGEPLLSANIS